MKRLAAWVLILAMLPIAGLAETLNVEIASCSVGNGSTVATGTTVHFSIRSEGAVRTQLMIVPPDSSRIGAEGPEADVVLDLNGTWAFVAYAKGEDGTLVNSEQWRIKVAGDSQAVSTPNQGETDVHMFTWKEGNRFDFDERAVVFWIAPAAEEGTIGWLNLYKGDQLISGWNILGADVANGSQDVTDALRKGGRGQYRAELKLSHGTEVTGTIEIALERYDRYMDFADEICGLKGQEEKLAFNKWRRNTKPAGDQRNSGYLMLDILLDPDNQDGFDFENKDWWNLAYQSVFIGLKRDYVSLIMEAVDWVSRGGGEKYYTDALIQSYVQFMLTTLNGISEAVLPYTAEEKAADLLEKAGTLSDFVGKSLDVWNDNLADDVKIARNNVLDYSAMLPFQGDMVPSTDEGIDEALSTMYDISIFSKYRNTPEAIDYREAFEQFQEAKNRTYTGEAVSMIMDWGGFFLDGATSLFNTIKVNEKLKGEKQQAADMLIRLANASNIYMECLYTLYNESTYRRDNKARVGLKKYIELMEQVLNATLEEANGKGLDNLASEIASHRTAGDIAGVIISLCKTITDYVKLVKPETLEALKAIKDNLKKYGFDNYTQLAKLSVSLTATVIQEVAEGSMHITDKYEAARTMYVIQQLIQDSSVVIGNKQDEYFKDPTHDRAVVLCGLVSHLQALKRQGEVAAWAFISIDMEDTITKLYDEIRDEFCQEIQQQMGMDIISRLPTASVGNAMSDWTLFHILFDVYVGDEKKKCERLLDLAMLADEYGSDNIMLKLRFGDNQYPIEESMKPFLEKCVAMQKMTVDIFREDFDRRAGWIEIYQPPR